MKRIMKNRKNSGFPKFIKILMAGLMIFGVMQIPSESMKMDNVVHSMDAETKASFEDVGVAQGAKIFLGGQPATYVSDNTLLSDKTSGRVAGDMTSINNASGDIWNAYYSKDRADDADMEVLSQDGLPDITEIDLLKRYTPSVAADYWLDDTNTVSVDDGSGLTTTTGKKLEIFTRAYANFKNELTDNTLTIDGEFIDGEFIDGPKFDGKEVNLGNYINANEYEIVLNDFIRRKGWYKDLFSEIPMTSDRTFFAKYRFADPSYNPEKPNNTNNQGSFGFPGSSDYDGYSEDRKARTMKLYATPDCNESGRVHIKYDNYNMTTGTSQLMLYSDETQSFEAPEVGNEYRTGTKLVYFFMPSTQIAKIGGDKGYIKIWGTSLLDGTDTTKLETVSGLLMRGKTPAEGAPQYIQPDLDKLPLSYKDAVYVLYGKTPKNLKVTIDLDSAANTESPFYKVLTEGLRYYEKDTLIKGKSIQGATNAVRPKMKLMTSKIKFARENTLTDVGDSSTLGDMPTKNLVQGGNYKLVLNNDKLGVNDVAKGASITATGGKAPKGSVTENNVITITPGTTEITIPVSVKDNAKISAISTKKNGAKAYGVVGSGNSVTINIADLMDTSKVTSKTNQSKTITLFEEKHNEANYSDEISTTGLDITVKVENPQTIDFTQTTKNIIDESTFSEKETFEVNAKVTNKGIESFVDKTTPITFTADPSYLVRVGSIKWDEESLTATATFKVMQSQKEGVLDEKFMITINREGADSNDPALPVISSKVKTLMKEYDIDYDLNAPPGENPINSPDNNISTYKVENEVTIKPPSLTGYTFSGWTEQVTIDGKTLDGEAGTTNVDKSITINKGSIGNRKYIANWKINEYKLTLDLNGGTYSDSNIPTVITKPYQTKVPLTDPTPPDRKEFSGWSVVGSAPPGGGFGIGDEKNTYTMGAGDVTVQAQYKDMNQSIQFTAETETMLKNNTYAYGEEFEVEAEAIEVDGHLPDKTKGIVFSTQDTDYLEMVGKPTWNTSTFKAKATFKVVKPLPEGNANTLTIQINKPKTDTHNAAPQVSSTNVKTKKREIDLKIDSTIFVADKGEHRISLKAGEVMPDITQPPKIYKNGETTEDLVAIEDQKNNKIPYIVKTSHWLGNYTGLNGMNKDEVLIEDGKVSQKIAGNIWNLNIVEDTNSKEITWFEERYEVTGKSPIDAIVDVYDKTGNESITTSEILYVNNIAMSLKDYENKIANVEDKKQALINESNFKVTNMVAPYIEIKESDDSIDGLVKVLDMDSHAGEYKVQYNLYNGSGLSAQLIVADVITKNIQADEELRANTYIHQKGEPLLSDGAQGFQTLMKTEVIDLKTGKKKENMKFDVTIANPDVWKELGESTVNLKTDARTEVTSKIIVRDHAVTTGDIRVSANDLSLSKDEATALVNELKGKSIKEQASILTPTDPESKYGMYPYATNYVTGNRVLINNITGLPVISTSTGKVEAGVYDVTFETAGGGVTAQIKVRTVDPTAYVEIPAKIKLKKSNESNIVAEESDVVKLKAGVGVELDALKETILVETPSSFILKGISPSNTTTTELNVDVYTQGENGETKHDGTVPFATLDSKNTKKQYILRIMKTLPKHRKDLYVGKMNFKISFGKAVSEGGG